MSYHGMDPLKHFEFMFNAHTRASGKVRTRTDMLSIHHRFSYNDPVMDFPVQTEREIEITMGENDYNNFIASYGKYLDLVYAAERDPVVKDMMEKMMMYIILKR